MGFNNLVFVVYRVNGVLSQLPSRYRDRFGIETSYRVKNPLVAFALRPSTLSCVSYIVALAFILVNLWIWLLWTRLSRSRRGGRRVYREHFPP